MFEKQNNNIASSYDTDRPKPSTEQATSVRRLYNRLTSFAVSNGEPVRLELFGVDKRITQTRQSDIGTVSPYTEFSDDGLYVGEHNTRYTDVSGKEQDVRLIVANETGLQKLKVLAELNLEEVFDSTHGSRHTYRFYPDMNIGYVRDDWQRARYGDKEDDYFNISDETERRYLDAHEVDNLSILIDTLRVAQ
jgi:hypothetical protein